MRKKNMEKKVETPWFEMNVFQVEIMAQLYLALCFEEETNIIKTGWNQDSKRTPKNPTVVSKAMGHSGSHCRVEVAYVLWV